MDKSGAAVRMSVRVLDDIGGEIAWFFSEKPEGARAAFRPVFATRS
jgi:hypothetical protein